MIAEVLSRIAALQGLRALAEAKRQEWHSASDFDIAVFSYSDAVHFKLLWGISGDGGGLRSVVEKLKAARTDRPLTIIVVCDGIAEFADDPDLALFVTPYDWALALSLAIYGDTSCQYVSSPKLRILLFHNQVELLGTGFAQSNFFAFHNVVPWIQDYWPVEISSISPADIWSFGDSDRPESLAWRRQSVPQGRQDAVNFLRDLREPDRVLTTFSDDDLDRPPMLQNISGSWKEHLLHARSKHTIANLVAPLALAGALPASALNPSKRDEAMASLIGSQSLGRAVIEVLIVLGLLRPQSELAKLPPAGMLSGPRGIFERRWPISCLLVDDQFRLGFQHILAYQLFGNRYVIGKIGTRDMIEVQQAGKLYFDSTPDVLLRALGSSRVKDWSLPRNLRLGDANCEILFLDLRLWSDSSNAAGILDKVLVACKALGADEIKSSELKAAIRAVNNPTDREGKALSLLPLLISYYDPSLPIVLFSSTRQRAVVELVRSRRNIITDFVKPAVGRDGDEGDPAEALNDLRLAILKAVGMREDRLVWERLCRLNVNVSAMAAICSDVSTIDLDSKVEEGQIHQILAAWYQKYIQDERYSDLISSIGELIEWLFANNVVERRRYGWFASALRWGRNKKLHDFDPAIALQSKTDSLLRGAALVSFLVLIDFLQAVDKSKNSSKNEWSRMSEFLRRKYPALAGAEAVTDVASGNLLPGEELSKFDIELPEYVCLSLARAAGKAGSYLDEGTELALGRLIGQVVN